LGLRGRGGENERQGDVKGGVQANSGSLRHSCPWKTSDRAAPWLGYAAPSEGWGEADLRVPQKAREL
jgi:hypothetical protein